MGSELKAFVDLWPVIASLVGVVVWLVRLEGVTKRNRDMIENHGKDIEKLEAKYEYMNTDVLKQLSQVRESLARLEGRLGTAPKD